MRRYRKEFMKVFNCVVADILKPSKFNKIISAKGKTPSSNGTSYLFRRVMIKRTPRRKLQFTIRVEFNFMDITKESYVNDVIDFTDKQLRGDWNLDDLKFKE